ncbi:hypothetical protein [Phenylobacterium deserti]|uniref:hypothetical protein n=1 Tax=Phenylobacterium deserti TaxID=1914756 RepID=UPI001401C116|nr:hypothetical protein [Phenylobacterium deserti]
MSRARLITPVTYRPIAEVQPVKRKVAEPKADKAQGRSRPKLARKPDKGQGENLDMWV